MILEQAILDIVPGKNEEFEEAFKEAKAIISSMKGYISHELLHGIEQKNRYLLLVKWENLEDHVTGFRGSEEYKRWRELLHHFFTPSTTVEHFNFVNFL